jgi:hypothetical protein
LTFQLDSRPSVTPEASVGFKHRRPGPFFDLGFIREARRLRYVHRKELKPMYPALPLDTVTATQAAMTLVALFTVCVNYLLYIRA